MAKKDLDDIRSQYVPIEELGADPNDFVVDANYWYDEMYALYKDSCHFENPLDDRQSQEHHIAPDMIDEHSFCAIGRIGFFQWYALTLYYDESIHKMDEVKIKHNRNHLLTVCDQIAADPGENISHAINNNNELLNILQRDPIIANTEECVESWDSVHDCRSKDYNDIREMTVRLNVFMEQGPICPNVFSREKGKLIINPNTIQGKDVVLPFIWADKKFLTMYGNLAKRCIDNGANTVVGIFASRQVPTMDGREASSIPQKYRPVSFGPRFGFINIG